MGFELITQPQVFLAPITAVGGIQNGLFGDPLPPLYTSFYTWTSTASVTATTFPLGGIETLTNRSGSYIVTVGGVVQSPTNYTVNPNTRLLTFDFSVNADTPVVVTQIGTIATSALDITQLTATNSVFQNSTFNNITANNLLVTNLTALTAQLNIVDITQYELSGFNVLGDAIITGNASVSNLLSSISITTQALTVAGNISATGYITSAITPLVTSGIVTLPNTVNSIICTAASTLTLPSAGLYPGRWLFFKLTANAAVNSASTNIVPISSTTANNIILPQTGTVGAATGKWSQLQSNGTNWVTMAAN
jgi:hypothetical protein